ncbi:ATP-binding protein [Roseateles sp. GG27B]
MRIQQLDLTRYGKFTDQRLSFPAAVCDFHLIVGANEAGKSTTRSAILDLLFGIEMRSTYDFLHAKADMRLGATIEHGCATLEFLRSKARTKSLLDAQGQVLPDSALMPFLAATERTFFHQMFGLDHGRLEAGGNAILSTSNDVGQILFQSAAGIGSLGAVREQLAAEADELWLSGVRVSASTTRPATNWPRPRSR